MQAAKRLGPLCRCRCFAVSGLMCEMVWESTESMGFRRSGHGEAISASSLEDPSFCAWGFRGSPVLPHPAMRTESHAVSHEISPYRTASGCIVRCYGNTIPIAKDHVAKAQHFEALPNRRIELVTNERIERRSRERNSVAPRRDHEDGIIDKIPSDSFVDQHGLNLRICAHAQLIPTGLVLRGTPSQLLISNFIVWNGFGLTQVAIIVHSLSGYTTNSANI